jgi:hypothetical protein
VRTPNADTVYSTGVSEVDDPIVVDYSNAASGIVCITSLTQDARKDGEYVALTREIVDASREGEIVVRREVTLPPEPLDGLDKLLDETRALLHSSDDAGDRMDRFWINLLHLRNMAVTDPDRVMAAVELFSHDTPGHFGCIHNDIMGQIGQIKDCHDKPVEHIPTKAP